MAETPGCTCPGCKADRINAELASLRAQLAEREEALAEVRDSLGVNNIAVVDNNYHDALVSLIAKVINENIQDLVTAETKLAERDAVIETMRRALEALQKQLRCAKHTSLRHPLCGDCQALAKVEAALAQPAVEQVKCEWEELRDRSRITQE